jgi:hypothetical protein
MGSMERRTWKNPLIWMQLKTKERKWDCTTSSLGAEEETS